MGLQRFEYPFTMNAEILGNPWKTLGPSKLSERRGESDRTPGGEKVEWSGERREFEGTVDTK